MEEILQEKKDETEIDLQRIISALWQKAWLILVIAILCGALIFAATYYFITPVYQSSAMFYVNNSSLSLGDASLSIDSGDISASKNLVDSYIVILNTRTSLNDVIDYAGVDYTYKELRDMISAVSVNETEIFEVVVTGPDPYEAERIANAIAYILPKRIDSIIEGTSAKIVDTAIVAASPSSPSYTTNTIVGFLLGLVLTVAVIVLQEIFDITIRTEEDVAQTCTHPVLSEVPDMGAPSRGGYYYGYGNKKKGKKRTAAGHGNVPAVVGENISFVASEAYKLLRTKLQFSFADDSNSRVIGISSALSGEGKSLSAVNLAYSLSQLDKKVLLIDCDMRRPTLAEKLKINKQPGLSGYLAGQQNLEDLIQSSGASNGGASFDVIAAGQNPPNPIELLSSVRMTKFLVLMRQKYDYIILDLPPVGEVSDAMAVAKETDGILLVVRQNYCNRLVLKEAVRQFEFIEARILGVVYNCTAENGGRYGKGYYKRYYRKYGKRYSRYYGRYHKQSEQEQNNQ